MTRKEVIEGNKLIAEFMGYSVGFPHKTDKYSYIQTVEGYIIPSIVNPSPHPSDIDTHQFSLTDLRFHSSWDWLMLVVDKVILINMGVPRMTRIYFNTFRYRKYHPTEHTYKVRIHNDFKDFIIKTESNSEIEATWLAITQFIKWYNSCKKE